MTTSSARPAEVATNPPSEPRVFDSVPTCTTSTPPMSAMSPKSASTGPSTAWASSSTSRASWRAASRQRPSRSARSPSIENTVSETTSARRASRRDNSQSRWSRSAWRYTSSAACESRQPSMIDAWLSSSEHTSTSRAPKVVSTPRLAANPVGNSTARSVPFHSASARSSSPCTGREPTMSRADPEPAPQRSSASCAAATTAGCCVKPR